MLLHESLQGSSKLKTSVFHIIGGRNGVMFPIPVSVISVHQW